jgi:hypothetical protein
VPGWYRFAINRKKDSLQLYLEAGSLTGLITDASHVYEINRLEIDKKGRPIESADRHLNTRVGSFRVKQSPASEYLQMAQPVNAVDGYPTQCHPLAEEVAKSPE